MVQRPRKDIDALISADIVVFKNFNYIIRNLTKNERPVPIKADEFEKIIANIPKSTYGNYIKYRNIYYLPATDSSYKFVGLKIIPESPLPIPCCYNTMKEFKESLNHV